MALPLKLLVVASNAGGGIARHLDLTATALGHELPTLVLSESEGLASKVSAVRRELNARRPAHIVTHGVAAGLAVRLLRRRANAIPHVEFWHGDPFFLQPARRAAFRLLAAAGAAPSEQIFVNRSLIGLYGDRRAARRALPNTVPIGRTDGEPVPRTAVFLGRLSPEKGFADLLGAWPRVERSWTLRMYGAGPGGLGALPHGVLALGETVRPLEVVAAASLVCVPSWIETSPYTALEAMSLSRPLVATRTGDLPDLLASGCGWLAAPRDVADLADALVQATGASDEERRQRGAEGRRWLAENRPFDAWAQEIQGIYGR